MEVFEQRLHEWPSHLDAEKELLRTNTCGAIAAESSEDWERASHHYNDCLEILTTNKPSISQELLLWLVKRICVPVAFVNQFRLRRFKVAFKALRFMYNYIWLEYDYGDGGRTWKQNRLKYWAETMLGAVLYDAEWILGKEGAEKVDSEVYRQLWTALASEDLKARCCEYLCVQYYILGQFEDVWRWHSEWKRSLTLITADEEMRTFQHQDCYFAEACLLAELGEVEKSKEIQLNLDSDGSKFVQTGLPYLARKIYLGLGDPESADLEQLKITMNLEEMSQDPEMEEFRLELISLLTQTHEAAESARYKDAMDNLQKMVGIIKGNPCYRNDQSLPSAVCTSFCDLASFHDHLFHQKELKCFIDMGNDCSPEDKLDHTSMSLKLCVHHCLSPHCQKSHCEVEDESHFQTPASFFSERDIESDGNNLHHLESAVGFLAEALDLADKIVKRTGNTDLVAKVHSSLARIHLLIAEYKCRPLMKSSSLGAISPEVLVANGCHTIQQVQEYLELNGTSPEASFRLARYHYRQCAELLIKRLDSHKSYGELWIPIVESHKDLNTKLQLTIFKTLEYYKTLHDVLQEALRSTGEEVASCIQEFRTIASKVAPECLLWSERGRARLLEYQLRGQQPEVLALEPDSNDLSAFDLDDEVAWDVLRSSLDACGEGTVFLEFSFEVPLDLCLLQKDTTGRLYGVKKERGMILESVLVFVLHGNSSTLLQGVQDLHEALSSPQYVEADVVGHLEKLYQFLIEPVAEFLKDIHYEHKLVICPSQIFTEVPFAILRNPAEKSPGKGYLFQSHTISITPSLRVLKYNKERYLALQKMELMEGQGAAVAIGDPVYKDPKRQLKHSGEEVEFIATLFPNRCAQVKNGEATVENLMNWAKLPTKTSCSQAFAHIAAHASTAGESGNKHKHGVLRLTELHDTLPSCRLPTDGLQDFQRPDGTLSAEDIVKSKIEWRARMVVLSACSSGAGEIKAEGVLNLPRAFMVAGVPCSVVSQWPVEDSSTAQLMMFFYQGLLKGMDAATALQSSMQQMLDNGSNIKQWGAFMVWGLPTVCLPDELLSKDTSAVFLQIGKELVQSKRYSDALLPLKKSLELMKANENHINKDDLVQCLCWLADCEEVAYRLDTMTFLGLSECTIDFDSLRFVSRHHRDDLIADGFRHLDSAIQYFSEALKHAKVGGITAPTQLDVQKRLATIHDLKAGRCFIRMTEVPLPNIIDGIQAVLETFQANGISAEDSWRKAFEHYVEQAKLCSYDMDHSIKGSEAWISAATSRNDVLLSMQDILHWRLQYLDIIKQHLIDRRKRLKGDGMEFAYTIEFRNMVSTIAAKEMWLHRLYTPPWEHLLGWRTIPDATWDLLKMDSLKETWTFARGCGDVVVEYVLNVQFSKKFMLICVMSQGCMARLYVSSVEELNKLEFVLTRTASMMSAYNNFKSHSFLDDLQYLHELLIKPILEDPVGMLKSMHHGQKLVFIPCELLAAVPFALLRDPAQPDGEGFLIQSHTISITPSLRILEHCNQCLQDLQTVPLLPDCNANLVLTNPTKPKEKEPNVGLSTINEPGFIASQFPTQCRELHGSDAAVESLVDWAELACATKEHCQGFFHIEAEIDEDNGTGILKLANFQENIKQSSSSFGEVGSGSRSKDGKLSSEAITKCGFQWRVHMAVLRACESSNGQIQKNGVVSLVKAFMVMGVPCVVTSLCPVDDVSSHNFFAHLYTRLKDGDDVASAVRYSMLQMKKDGFGLNQWGIFSAFGVPTVCLPQEMLWSNEELLQNGRKLLDSHRYSEAVFHLRKTLNMLRGKDDNSIRKSFDILRCLCWLGECEEGLFKFKYNQSLGQKYPSIEFDHMMFALQHRRNALEPDQLIHLYSAIECLVEALKVSYNTEDMLLIGQSVQKRLGLLHFLEGLFHYQRLESQALKGNLTCDSMQGMLVLLQWNGIKCQDSWKTSAQYFLQHLNMCSNLMDGERRDSESWLVAVDSQIETTELLSHVMRWEREYCNTIYRYLITDYRRRGAGHREATLTRDFQLITGPHVVKEIWLERKSRLRWEVPVGRPSTRTFAEMDLSIEIRETCGKGPVILEYNLDLDITKTVTVHVTLQESGPLRIFCTPIQEPQKLELVLRRLCPSMADMTKFDDESINEDLEYLYNLLIKHGSIVEPILKHMSPEQKLIIVPGKVLAMVPFALLRDPDQPHGKGYLIQSHTISVAPSLRILERCCQQFQILESLPLVPGSKASLVIGASLSSEGNELFERTNGEIIASQFPNHCSMLVGPDATVESLLDWARLPSKTHCQGFIHIEAHVVFDEDMQQEVVKLADSTVDPLPTFVNSQTTDHKDLDLQSLDATGYPVAKFESSGTEKLKVEEEDVDEALENAKRLSLGLGDVGSRTSTSSSNGQLSAEAIARSPFEWWVNMVVLKACEAPKSQMQAEGVLNMARAFMVAGVPCVVISHWLSSDAWVTSVLFNRLYQHMKKDEDVATALRHAMLEMLDDGFGIEHWGAYLVFGLPTVHLPHEMLVDMAHPESTDN